MPFNPKMAAVMGSIVGGSGGSGGVSAWTEIEKFSTEVTTENVNPGGHLNMKVDSALLGTFSDIFGCTRKEFNSKMGISFFDQYYMTLKYDGVEYTDIFNSYDDFYACFEDRLLLYSGGVEDPKYPFCVMVGSSGEEFYIVVTEPGTHTVEIIVGETVKTNCDLMIKCDSTLDAEGNWNDDVKLVKCDFASAKAKINKGLLVTVYECITIIGNGVTSKTNLVGALVWFDSEGDDESIYVDGCFSYRINPDNTIELG